MRQLLFGESLSLSTVRHGPPDRDEISPISIRIRMFNSTAIEIRNLSVLSGPYLLDMTCINNKSLPTWRGSSSSFESRNPSTPEKPTCNPLSPWFFPFQFFHVRFCVFAIAFYNLIISTPLFWCVVWFLRNLPTTLTNQNNPYMSCKWPKRKFNLWLCCLVPHIVVLPLTN